MLASALAHWRRQQRLVLLASRASRKAWDTGNYLPLLHTIVALQTLAAADAIASTTDMLTEQNIDAPPAGELIPAAFTGTASDGRGLSSLFQQATSSPALNLMSVTQVQDTARGAAGAAIAVRRNIGYVRMLSPPSCARCAILGGAYYKWNTGFERHPHCDCRHIPTVENVAGDLRTNPHDYFDSLSRVEQDRIFTKAGAEAARNGADLSQVVNARQGMSTATLSGRELRVTTTGTTRRSGFGRTQSSFTKTQSGGRYARTTRARLMPESIMQVATSQDDAIRLLRLYGYIT